MSYPISDLAVPMVPGDTRLVLRRSILHALATGWRMAQFWRSRARQRRHLSELDAHLLDDIGVDPRSARREAAKWIWQD